MERRRIIRPMLPSPPSLRLLLMLLTLIATMMTLFGLSLSRLLSSIDSGNPRGAKESLAGMLVAGVVGIILLIGTGMNIYSAHAATRRALEWGEALQREIEEDLFLAAKAHYDYVDGLLAADAKKRADAPSEEQQKQPDTPVADS